MHGRYRLLMRLPLTNLLLVLLVLAILALSPMSVFVCRRMVQPENRELADDSSCADQIAAAAQLAQNAYQFLTAALVLPALLGLGAALSRRPTLLPRFIAPSDFMPVLQTPPPRI